MYPAPRRKGRLKQLNKANRRLLRHYPESEFIARLKKLEQIELYS